MSAHCLFCGGLLDATACCEVCRIQRVERDEKRIGAPCPRCHGARLGPFELGPVVVQGCVRCRGMFVATTEWDALLDFTRDRPPPPEIILGRVGAMATAAPTSGNPYREAARDHDVVDVPAVSDAPNLVPTIRCPVCTEKMERIEFAGTSLIDVDVCAPHGIWLDAGELAHVVQWARGSRALTQAPEPSVRLFARGLFELFESARVRRR